MTRRTYYFTLPDSERPSYDPGYGGYGGHYKIIVEKDQFGIGLIVGILVAFLTFVVMVSLRNNATPTDAPPQAYEQPRAQDEQSSNLR